MICIWKNDDAKVHLFFEFCPTRLAENVVFLPLHFNDPQLTTKR
jgi:hypothetical protein